MMIYPAIDIKGGKCVRLVQGDAGRQTVYEDDPLAAALRWQSAGAQWLHVVDLDGAFVGASANMEAIKSIVLSVDIPVQLGGGMRSMDVISYMLDEVGVSRVVIGTAAIEQPSLVEQAVRRYDNRIAVGIDAKGGMVAVRGWVDITGVSACDLAGQMSAMGVKTIIYTDISKDGMLAGPNVKAIADMAKSFAGDVIASGGVSDLDDIKRLKEAGAAGVIIGKALYDGRINLEDALELEE
ncbi:1-(5-phosphoribosyl)-5-[(5-phosphoribosylamino)methylideneamino]imidazole-4-carboxamide isomerase [Mahella australiensis]|uniref:1-(5-phosphoribosyl)-5-[(5-phosphoribosylamino)methylideneamino] imidazole-4-carboxamide isomerase n=1 Tax=Mahella australiensis (strain DSM 15567 / CIP 107919 / 50-1 BON) TaxID=697281 RepID=F3ZX36_MAHA5|nr:1-(5-phosphoribosyl)-5-[(5-phosphoribosylamino)methylideneamino]imidazole-4-carboxamide isomerase [Mahella australiensis]AEE95485.1 1-(5-phosphoribosyl)-5-((5-phosphoribosylamino)methylideneamino) imidazole-4-carboxamide isomerase [Mahella australiensis 50-1 BON]